MRVTPRDLRGIQREGLVTRFAILGPVAFGTVEVRGDGSAGTALERPTEAESWGFVLRGSLRLHGSREQTLPAGTAFYVPGGPPAHWFSAPGRVVAAGFAPVRPDLDASDGALRAAGWTAARSTSSTPLPETIRPLGASSTFQQRGSIEVELAQMGQWVFARNSFGPLSGYTSGWCDLPHWGMVLSGDLALKFEDDVELLAAGDIYYCPPGPPAHQFQVPDAATTIDYTPLDDLRGPARKAEWRRLSARRLRMVEVSASGNGASPRTPPLRHDGRGDVQREGPAGAALAGAASRADHAGPRPAGDQARPELRS